MSDCYISYMLRMDHKRRDIQRNYFMLVDVFACRCVWCLVYVLADVSAGWCICWLNYLLADVSAG